MIQEIHVRTGGEILVTMGKWGEITILIEVLTPLIYIYTYNW